MMRIDVDFNERDRRGHVMARVPAAQAARLTVGQRVNLYDPPEKLWADAVVARVNPETHIAAFDVDWCSFVDAEVADVTGPDSRWSIGVPPSAGMVRLASGSTCSCNAAWPTKWAKSSPLRGVIVASGWAIEAGDWQAHIETVSGTANAAGLNERAAR